MRQTNRQLNAPQSTMAPAPMPSMGVSVGAQPAVLPACPVQRSTPTRFGALDGTNSPQWNTRKLQVRGARRAMCRGTVWRDGSRLRLPGPRDLGVALWPRPSIRASAQLCVSFGSGEVCRFVSWDSLLIGARVICTSWRRGSRLRRPTRRVTWTGFSKRGACLLGWRMHQSTMRPRPVSCGRELPPAMSAGTCSIGSSRALTIWPVPIRRWPRRISCHWCGDILPMWGGCWMDG